MADRIGIRKAGNAGLVTTTGGNDLLHTQALMTVQTVTFPSRTFIIRKIMWYVPAALGNVTLDIGTLNATPALVPLLPTILCLAGFDGELGEADLPGVEFIAAAPGEAVALRFNGNAYVLSQAAGVGVAGVLVAVEIEEFGA